MIYDNLMIDTETLGNAPDSAVIQLAACKFEPFAGGKITSTFSSYIKAIDGSVNIETILWWMQQPYSKDIASKIDKIGHSSEKSISNFVSWFNDTATRQRIPYALQEVSDNTPVWAHGSDFDLPIVRNMAAKHGVKLPWKYSMVRDTRTLYAIKGKPTIAREGIHHDALDDCIYQAKCVQEVLSR